MAKTVQRTGASRFAQRQIKGHRRLAPVADLCGLAVIARMTPEAFQRIEQKFGVSLPDWYRRRILEYPFSEPDDALYHDEASIVRANEELRRDGWYDFPWPREFFVIGDTGCGDSYFIVPSTQDKRIFIANHEGGPAPSFPQLGERVQAEAIEQHISETQEIIRDAALIAERRRNKKWWQFWL